MLTELCFALLTKYYLGDPIEKNEMDGACSRDGEWRGSCGVFMGTPEGKRPFERQKLSGSVILKWIFMKWDGNMNRIYIAQDRNKWRAVLNAVVNVRVP